MGQAASHQGKGWERFTDAVVAEVNAREQPAVFMLWGSYAQRTAAFVDSDRHLVLTSPHPSPLSAYNGFFGCSHFSRAIAFLEEKVLAPLDWELADAARPDRLRGGKEVARPCDSSCLSSHSTQKTPTLY